MFRKLIANLPFSPSLVGKLNAYSKHIKNELSARKIGFVFISLTLLVQLLTLLSPISTQQKDDISNLYSTETELSTNIFASNLSQGFVDAKDTVAKSNDQISYTLSASNNGQDKQQFAFRINLKDITEYSSMINQGGGSFDEATKILSWPSLAIEPGSTQTRTIITKVLQNIPTNAISGTSYDCKQSTTFGNQIDVNIDCPQIKTVESLINMLPKVSRPLQLATILTLLLLSTIMLVNSWQIEKEIKVIRKDINSGTL